MEPFLNVLWVTIAAAALFAAPQRSGRVLLALGCALIVLFPIVSASDDLGGAGEGLEQALALVAGAVVLRIALAAIGRMESAGWRRIAFSGLTTTDPRSPPRR